MKTLNRTLSLTLVFALVFSLMSFAFAADTTTTTTTTTGYTDAASITYKQAVDVTTAIGVFQGNDSKAFAPKDNLTREQAAKVICYLTMGKAAADKLTTSAAPFTDVPADRWSAGSIAYCAKQGIVAGYGDGKFGPTDTVTGYQFAKMLLVALGYDATIEQFNGSDWSINVAKRAFANKLFSGNSAFVGTNNVTREESALYTLNMIKRINVTYATKGTDIIVNGVTVKQGASAPSQDAANGTYYSTHFSGLVPTASTVDAMGRPATKWTYNGTKIGTYAVEADYTFTAAAAGSTDKAKIASMGLTGFTISGTATLAGNTTLTFANVDTLPELANATANGRLVELYVNDDDATKIDKIVINDSYLAKINSINTTTKLVGLSTVDAGKSYTVDNDTNPTVYTALSAMAVKAYVLITPAVDGTSIANVAVPKTVTGALTSIGKDSAGNNASVTVAGTSYGISLKQKGLNTLGSANLSSTANTTLYLDSYGYAIYITDTTATSNYFIPLKTSLVTKNGVNVTMAIGYTTAGTPISLNIGSQPIVVNKAGVGLHIYKYTASTTSEATLYDSEYTISAPMAVASATTPTAEKFAVNLTGINYGTYTYVGSYWNDSLGTIPYYPELTGAESITGAVDSNSYSSDVKFIYIDSATNTVTVKSGVQLVPAGTPAFGFYTTDPTDSKVYVSAVIVPAAPVDATSANVLFLDSLKSTSTTGATTTYTYNAYVDGVYQAITSTSDATSNLKKFYNYSKDATTSVYTLALATADITNSSNAVKNSVAVTAGGNDNLIKIGGTDYNAANATIIDEGNTGIGSLTELNAAFAKHTVNVAVVYNNVTTSASYRTISYIYILNAVSSDATPTAATVTNNGVAVTPVTLTNGSALVAAQTTTDNKDIVITFTLPAGASITSVTGNTAANLTSAINGSTVTLHDVAIAAAETKTVTITITAADGVTTTTHTIDVTTVAA